MKHNYEVATTHGYLLSTSKLGRMARSVMKGK